MNSSLWSEWVLPHFPFTSQKSESQTEESKRSTLIKKASKTNQKPNQQNQINLFLPSQIQLQYAFSAIHPHLAITPSLPADPKIGLGIKVPRHKQTEEVPHRLRLGGSSGKGTPGAGIWTGGRRPLVPDPASFTLFPPGAGLL